jgi:hypothetical protein
MALAPLPLTASTLAGAALGSPLTVDPSVYSGGSTGGIEADAAITRPLISIGSLVRGRVTLSDRRRFAWTCSEDTTEPKCGTLGDVVLRAVLPVPSLFSGGESPPDAGEAEFELVIAIGESTASCASDVTTCNWLPFACG